MQEKTEQIRFKVIIDASRAEVNTHAIKVARTRFLGNINVEVPEPTDPEIKDMKINEGQTIAIFDFSNYPSDVTGKLLYYVFLFCKLGNFPLPTKAQSPQPTEFDSGEVCIISNPAEELLFMFQYNKGTLGNTNGYPYVLYSKYDFVSTKFLRFTPKCYTVAQWQEYLENRISITAAALQTFKDKLNIK